MCWISEWSEPAAFLLWGVLELEPLLADGMEVDWFRMFWGHNLTNMVHVTFLCITKVPKFIKKNKQFWDFRIFGPHWFFAGSFWFCATTLSGGPAVDNLKAWNVRVEPGPSMDVSEIGAKVQPYTSNDWSTKYRSFMGSHDLSWVCGPFTKSESLCLFLPSDMIRHFSAGWSLGSRHKLQARNLRLHQR